MFHFERLEAALVSLNGRLERLMPLITIGGMVTGIIFHRTFSPLKPAVSGLFAFITFSSALAISPKRFFGALTKTGPILLFLLWANLVMPLLSFSLGSLLFTDPNLVTGFVLLTAIPTAMAGYIWSGIYHGDEPLSLVLILVSTFLGPILTPLTVKLLAQKAVAIDTKAMVESLLMMIVLPSLAGILINHAAGDERTRKVTPSLKPLAKIALFMIVTINVARIAPTLLEQATPVYLPVALLSAFLAFIGYPAVHVIGKIARLPLPERKSLTFAASMRNISASMVLAINYFPPLTALPIIFGIVFQQSICAIMAAVLYGPKRKEIPHEQS
ncbi:MAG: bile acid:sodium symporter family protein [Spirochaetales bacterium]|nr:bile acid:sodium symporter family protein [Spirochaetales bacterium]